jgi:ribosome maturation factor RimP
MAKNPELHARLMKLTSPEIEALDLDLVELELLAGGNRVTLRYALERRAEPGTTAEERRAGIREIARASRAVARAIEAEEAERGDFMPGRYTIEVSSPGIFRPLVRPEHFQRFCGERIRLIAMTTDETREYHGVILSADELEVEVDDENEGPVSVPFDRISKANLDPVLDFGR